MTTVRDVMQKLSAFAPPVLAADWDNTGLLLGDTQSEVERLLCCLTITPAVVEEAVAERANLILSHHPVLFRGVKRLTIETPEGRLLLPLLANSIAVYSPHTAFDNCMGGINDGLAARLGLTDTQPLRPREHARVYKLAVFTPESDLAKVSDALFAAGAGHIGNYSECSFRTLGTGTFHGDDSTNPAIGQKGRREEASEWRLEVIVPEASLIAVISAMKAAHSYEVPAFDIYPLKTVQVGGEGRVGNLPKPEPLGDLAARMKSSLRAHQMQIVGDRNQPIRRVAVACGAAGEFLPDAIKAGADAFLTGEVRFHDCLAAEAAGIALVLPGHYASERPAVEDLTATLASDFPGMTIWPSRRETDPLKSV